MTALHTHGASLIGLPVRVLEWRFTARGRFLLGAIAALGLIGADTRHARVFELFAIALALLIVAAFLLALRRGRLAIHGRLPVRLTAGQVLPLRLRVSSSSAKPQEDVVLRWPRLLQGAAAPRARPDETYLALEPHRATEVKLDLVAPRRGRFRLPGPLAQVTDPLRLIAGDQVRLPEESVLVYPPYFAIEELAIPMGRRYQPGGIPLSSSTGDAIEFVGTRAYREGDPPRHLHWRSWARRGEPVVKEYQEEYFCRIALILDTYLPRGAGPARRDAFEAAISVVASVADYISRGDYVVDILAAGPDIYEVSAGRSLAYLDNILEVLAGIGPCHAPPFAVIRPHLFEKLARLTSVVAVLQDWDAERERFLRQVNEEGTAVRAFVVREGEPSQPLPAGDDPGVVTSMSPTQVREAIASGAALRIGSEPHTEARVG